MYSTPIKYNQILDILYSKYHEDAEHSFSDVTSSFWVEWGNKTSVSKSTADGNIEYGFHSAIGAFSRKKKDTIKEVLTRKLSTLINNNLIKRRMVNLKPTDFPLGLDSSMNLLLGWLLLKHGAQRTTTESALAITKELGIHFNFNHVTHVLSYDLIDEHGLFSGDDIICIIGDGHGFMGTLIKAMNPQARVLFVNLGRHLLIDALCFAQVFPESEPSLLEHPVTSESLNQRGTFFLEAEHYEWIQNLPIRLFINIASMQEMDLRVINRYFDLMRTSTSEPYIYCCNREEKTLSDGSIIRFEDYPWEEGDVLLDELCPWYQRYPNPRPPIWRPFDGPHRHRLAKLN